MVKKVAVIGLGVLGGSMQKSFRLNNCEVVGYDKFKPESDTFDACLNTAIAFLCLPTLFDEKLNEYDKSCIEEVCYHLVKNNFNGILINKSTVEPGTTIQLSKQFPSLKFIHNPEFLTAATAYEDFHNQKHIVLGKGPTVTENDVSFISDFYRRLYPDAEISICSSTESESMKSFVNCFYAVKIQFFNELYLLCQKMGCDYDVVKDLMLKNKWINPMHTNVPGTDGKLSYGGYCFPKDTNALLEHMKREGTFHGVLEATIKERNKMRSDNTNIKAKETKQQIMSELN